MIMDMARELGVAIAETPEYKRMSLAQAAVSRNASLQLLLSEFTQKRSALTSMLSSLDFDREAMIALSTDVERLQAQLRENPLFSEMLETEQAFSALLTSVDREINACIGRESDDDCTGDCTACGGCKH